MHVLTSLDRARVAELLAGDEFFWLDLLTPGDADLRTLAELLHLHPLALEDAQNFGQRPKLDDYGDYVFLVHYGARVDAANEPSEFEVHLFLSGGYIITLRRDECAGLDELRERLAQRDGEAEQHVVYQVLDTVTDTFFPVLARIDDEIDELQEAIVAQPTDAQLQRIFQLRRGLVGMRKVVTPQRDLFARAVDDISLLPGLEAGARDYLRDVYDHLIRISDLIDSYRDLLSGSMDVYLSTVSNRLNTVMKQLTILATVFLPLTVVTSFFGQNFGWLVRHIDSFGAFLAYGIGGLVVPCVVLYAWFKRSHYI